MTCLVKGWNSVPENQTACVGENVLFNWEYNETINGEVDGIYIAKLEYPKVDMVKWHRGIATIDPTAVQVVGNAGMILFNVQESQSGGYECSVYFKNRNQLHYKVTLNVTTGRSSIALVH